MASLSTSYQCIDDTGTSAGPAGGQAGGASGYPVSPVFTAPSLAAATTVAYLISSALQRPVRLVVFGGSPPWTLVVGAPAAVTLTSVPSGIGY